MTLTRQQAVVTVSAALDLIRAAIAEGERIGVPVSACVVDPVLTVIAFARSDGAIRGGLPISAGGSVAGALGVAGGTPAQDEAVATAALARLHHETGDRK